MNQWFDDCDNYGMDDLAWYKPYAIEIGGNIREQRKKKRVSQFELSLATGIDRSTVSRLEAGNRTIRLDTLGLIHQALSVPVTLLLPADWIEGTIEAECMKLTEEQQSVVKMALDGMINALKS